MSAADAAGPRLNACWTYVLSTHVQLPGTLATRDELYQIGTAEGQGP